MGRQPAGVPARTDMKKIINKLTKEKKLLARELKQTTTIFQQPPQPSNHFLATSIAAVRSLLCSVRHRAVFFVRLTSRHSSKVQIFAPNFKDFYCLWTRSILRWRNALVRAPRGRFFFFHGLAPFYAARSAAKKIFFLDQDQSFF